MALLIENISTLLTMNPDQPQLGKLENASVWVEGTEIKQIGISDIGDTPKQKIDATGCIGMPGLIDPHTHSIWAGSRSSEFEARLGGANYTEILESGGGILSTVRHTREASSGALRQLAWYRLQNMRQHGVTTVEIKSGYGLNPVDEARCLEIAGALPNGPKVVRTFLGAHAIPSDFRSNREAYVHQVINEQLPLAAPHADAIDVYCDRGAFTLEESIAILKAGHGHGLKIRAHAEQVTHTGIAAAAANLGATCVDHLEYAKETDVEAMANNGTVAVLLPGAQLFLKDPSPPTKDFRAAGIAMAIGTDLNPGSSPVHSLWLCATLSCLIQGLTVEEALLGITRHAAYALGIDDRGWLADGQKADLILLRPPAGEPPIPASLIQHIGHPHVWMVIQDGEIVYKRQ